MINGEMVLLHGFIKKTQKTPQQDIETTLERVIPFIKNKV
jgi:phage-related protein